MTCCEVAPRYAHAFLVGGRTIETEYPRDDRAASPVNSRHLSAATIWELAIKVSQKKLTLSMPFGKWLETAIADLGLEILPITVKYAERYSLLPPLHKDPFDRLIIAQSLVDAIPVVGVDVAFDPYGVTRIW